jgi:cell division protein FtsI (penicillin-binding protein 3)
MHQRYVETNAETRHHLQRRRQMLSTSIPYFDVYMDFAAEGLREKGGKRFRENWIHFVWRWPIFSATKQKKEYKRDLQRAYNEKQRYYLLQKPLRLISSKSFAPFRWCAWGVIKVV